jgi:TP901 family phage tail tape measure protein
MTTSTVRVIFLGDTRSAVASVGRLERSLGGVGRAAKTLGIGLGVTLGAAIASSVKKAAEFEQAMRNVNSIAGLSEKQLKRLSGQVLALAGRVGKSPRDLAEGLYQIVSSGFKANDALLVLEAGAKAARAGLTDTETATKAVVAALNAYHLPARKAREVSDILFSTVDKGVVTFEELAQQMGDLVPVAAPLGVKLEEVTAAMAALTLQGVPAAEAATRVKNVMLSLADPSTALKKLLQDNGFASGELAAKQLGLAGVLEMVSERTHGQVAATSALFTEKRALLGAVGLTGKSLQDYQRILEANQRATEGAGRTDEVFREQMKSLSAQWELLRVKLEAFAVAIGVKLLPVLRSLVIWLNENLPRIQRDIGAVLDAVRPFAEAIAGQIRAVVTILRGLLRGDWAEVWQGLRLLVENQLKLIRALFVTFVEPIGHAVLRLGETAVSALGRGLEGIVSAVELKLIGIKRAVTDAVDALFDAGKQAGSAIGRGLVHGLEAALRAVGDVIARLVKAPLNAFIDAWNRLEIPGFHFKIPVPFAPDIEFGFGPFSLPDIPRLAKGGIVERPTLAVVGEEGPEAVIPLKPAERDRAEEIMADMWRRIGPRFFPGAPLPRHVWKPTKATGFPDGSLAFVDLDSGLVYLSSALLRHMRKDPGDFKRIILHEWAHVFQRLMTPAVREGSAELFAAEVGPMVGTQLTSGFAYPALLGRVIRGAARLWGLFGQFMPTLGSQLALASFARGGIVRDPTLALLGERGPEAVIPLTSPRAAGIAEPPVVNLYFDNGMEWLRQFVRVEVDGRTPELTARIGREASRRLREGRF